MIKTNTIKHEIQLSFGSSDVKRTVIKQNSTDTHILVIKLYDKNNELSIDTSWNISISAIKGDNTHVLNSANISIIDNAIHVTMTRQMLATSGTEKCELIIQEGEKTLYSDTFLIYVEPNVQDGSFLESSDECDVIADTLNKVSGYEEQARNKKNEIDNMATEIAGTKEDINDTYSTLQTAVTNTNNLITENQKIATAEEARATAETTRQNNETIRQTNTSAAIQNAEVATERANNAAENCENIVDGTGLVKSSEKGQPNGVATLDGTGVLPKEQLPVIDEAISASKLQNTAAIGNSSKPVYFNADGVPVAIDYTLQSACTRSATTTISSGNSALVTSGAVYSGLNKKASYEEGTWTPVFFSTSGSKRPDSEYTTRIGKYVKIGTLIYLYACVEIGAKTLYCYGFAGLPFWDSYINKYLPMGHIGFIKNSIGEVTDIKRGNFNGYPYGMICTDGSLNASSTWELQCIIDISQPVS